MMDPLLPIEGKRYCRDHWSQVGKKLDPKQIALMKDTMVLASEIVSSPDRLDELEGMYVIVADQTDEMKNVKFNDAQRAMNAMAERGWRCIDISSTFAPVGSGILYFYALMERHDKSKPDSRS